MISTAPDQRLGCQALHLSPGGDRWALIAYIRTNTDRYRNNAERIADNWDFVTQHCREAKRFEENIIEILALLDL